MVVHAWTIREADEEQYDYKLLYDRYPNLFSIRLNYGGVFTPLPGRAYVGGKVTYVDQVDIDLFSVIELNDFIQELWLNVGGKLHYYFLDPTSDLDNGLYPLSTDIHVQNLSNHVGLHKLINVYIEKTVEKLKVKSLCKGKSVVSTVEDNGSESEDSDFVIDDDFGINDIEVNMHDFDKHVDSTVEYIGPSGNVDEEVVPFNDNRTNVTNTEDFDTDDDSEDEMVVPFNENRTNAINTEDFDTDDDSEDEMVANRNMKIRNLRLENVSEEGNVGRTCFYLGQTFSDSKEVKEMIKKHCVETKRELKMKKNDKYRVRTVCIGKCPQLLLTGESTVPSGPNGGPSATLENPDQVKCPWTLHISKLKGQETWQVKTLIDVHHCLQARSVKAFTSEYLSHEIVDIIQDNPHIPIRALKEQIERKFELGISKMKAFRAKTKAAMLLKGDYTSQYGILRDYCLELMRTNPGSTIKIEVEDEPNPVSDTRKFKRIYICLGALKQGFKSGLREILGLDGAFMKGPYPGQILTAVGIDGNNSIYPVAYALVEAGTLNSWTWFLECLGKDLDLSRMSNFTFVSDRQKGLIPAIARVFPCAEHRYCVRHIFENMKLSWKGKAYKEVLWRCATSTTVAEFELGMKKLRELNPECANWLGQIPPRHWSRSHFSCRSKCDVLLNNLCEVFNRQLVDGRDKPIIVALEYVREYLMKRIVNVQMVIQKSYGPLTPTATKTLEAIKKEAAKYRVVWNGGAKYQVCGPWMDQCVVDTTERVCSCRKWELTGIPCKHAAAVIWNMSLGLLESWVDKAYWLDTWKNVYSFKIGPINGRYMWPKSDVPTTLIAPKHHTPPGRPRKKRKRGIDEVSSSQQGKLTRAFKHVTCGICKGVGHNKRTCNGSGNQAS